MTPLQERRDAVANARQMLEAACKAKDVFLAARWRDTLVDAVNRLSAAEDRKCRVGHCDNYRVSVMSGFCPKHAAEFDLDRVPYGC